MLSAFIITEPAASSFKILLPKKLNNSSLSNSARSSRVLISFSANTKILSLLSSLKLYKSSFTLVSLDQHLSFQLLFSQNFSSLTNSKDISSSKPSIDISSSREASAISDIVIKPRSPLNEQ